MNLHHAKLAMQIATVLAVFARPSSRASEAAAERLTQDALGMDAHPDQGAAPF
jgi:hypothetical protein